MGISNRGHRDMGKGISGGELGMKGCREAGGRIPPSLHPRRGRRVVACLTALTLAAAPAACDRTDERVVAPGTGEGIAVHGVLDPGLLNQEILVERLLTGREEVQANTLYDPLDPVVTGGGAPLTGARVVVYRDGSGDSAVALEQVKARTDGRGAGVYRVRNRVLAGGSGEEDPSAIPIVSGATYRLLVRAADGRVVTGRTTIPASSGEPRFPRNQPFNRDRDSLFIFWQPVAGAARYTVRVESPRGPVLQFVDSLEYLISGSLRDASESPFPRVFLPGFTQYVSVSAVDANYYDYYRSRNDRYSGRGLVNRLEGGVGVFGSTALLQEHILGIEADSSAQIEGLYLAVRGGGPNAIRIYLDEELAPNRLRLSGFHFGGTGSAAPGLLAELVGRSMSIALLRAQSAADTLMAIDGRWDGFKTITGTDRKTGEPVEYRKP